MLGIDAGDIHLIRSAGKLPRLQQLMAEGPLFRLESTAETLSSSVWPTFSSAAMPGHHGIYYPMQWDAAAMTLRAPARSVLEACAWALLIGGGISNLADRALRAGAVVDFLNVGLGPLRTGIFNVADVGITAGTILLIAGAWLARRTRP